MTRRWLLNRLAHSCSIDRDSGTAQSATGEIQRSWASVGTNVPCRYASRTDTFANEAAGFITRSTELLMLRSDEDASIEDRVHSIVDGNGNAVGAGTYSISEILKRRDNAGTVYHISAKLERVDIS